MVPNLFDTMALNVPRPMKTALLLALSTMLACGGEPPAPSDGQVEGAKLATSLVEQLNSSLQLSAPFRCARVQTDRPTPRLEGMTISILGAVVRFETLAEKKSLTLAAVSDARGNEAETLAAIKALRSGFEEKGVDVVLSLGGHGTSQESIQAVLSALAKDAPYLTVAIPGDRESVSAHREAVSGLADSGAKIIDGAQYRVLSFGKIAVATMPGISMGANLIAKNDGCLHTRADATDLLKHLPSGDAALLLASYAPLRQESRRGSDIGVGGIHTGETELQELLTNKSIAIRVHGMVHEPDGPAAGKLKLGQAQLSLATGSLDPLDGRPSALVLSVAGKRVTWERIETPR